MKQNKKIKVTIIILAVALGISLLALGGTLLYNQITGNKPSMVEVPDNLITSDEETAKPQSTDEPQVSPTPETTKNDASETGGATTPVKTSASSGTSKREAATISLYNRKTGENTPFKVQNMFPGDTETKYYRIQVSYHGKITVHYKADVRPGYEKLAEVLKVRVKLLTTGETLYDGLMRDMPKSLTHKMSSAKSTTGELYYEITGYLDTSVGNEYQYKDLIADFKWWVEETGNLEGPPKTSDVFDPMLWAIVAGASICAIIIILIVARRRREDKKDD